MATVWAGWASEAGIVWAGVLRALVLVLVSSSLLRTTSSFQWSL
jgi:hypothetical protein